MQNNSHSGFGVRDAEAGKMPGPHSASISIPRIPHSACLLFRIPFPHFDPVFLTVNGRRVEVALPPGARLLELLRDHCHLPGTKLSCGHGECGACTVILNGELAYSCLVLAAACEGADVTTVEGLAPPDEVSPLQRAFIAHDAVQCGFCTGGQLVAATVLLAEHPDPSDDDIREAMSGNLCRCGTYPKIAAAIRAVARGEFAGTEPAAAADAR
jgi:aerobic-type carbon monoxide dehydrogenase small subunit (CoxS/CutS family)